MVTDEVATLFAALGLSSNAAATYYRLLSDGPLPIASLILSSTSSTPTFHTPLEELITHHLIFLDGQDVWVLNPKKSFAALANNLEWSIWNTIPIHLRHPTKDQLESIRIGKAACRSLGAIASTQYSQRSPISIARLKIAKDSESLATMLSEVIDQANHHIYAVSTSPRLPQLAMIWASLIARMKNGITYSRVADLQEIEEHGFHYVSRDIHKLGIRLKIQEPSVIRDKFYLVDSNYVVFFYPLGGGFTLTGQVMQNRLIASKYKRMFDIASENALPAAGILHEMSQRRTTLIERARALLSHDGVKWFQCLCDKGVFCSFAKNAEQDLISDIQKALTSGLVEKRKQYTGQVFYVPCYGWNFADLKTRLGGTSANGA